MPNCVNLLKTFVFLADSLYLCACMRVLIVNTSERTGGAAVAANRLMEALINNGVKAKMLVRDKETGNICVVRHPKQRQLRWAFLWERLVIWPFLGFRRRRLFEVDIANCGADITSLPEFQEADVIHLHWVNQGMLSLKQLRKILDSGKRVVWTMHDIWPATSICHLTLDCRQFESSCGRQDSTICPSASLAKRVWRKKQTMLEGRHVTFVACSEWLAGEARKSALLKSQTVVSIPNPINIGVYKPGSQQAARKALGLPLDRKLILFASQRVTNEYKGMHYLIEACRQLTGMSGVGVMILGGHAEEVVEQLPFDAFPLGYVNDEQRIVQVYQAADVFVLPSLSENLPNTIMEAMACGVPCVGFNVGGIPEEIDNRKTGYVANYKDADDLARGLQWVLCEADHDALSKACVRKVAECYSQQNVAKRYISIYED